MQVIEDRPFFPWGVKLYPSGEFVLWRKQREKAERQKEAFVCAGSWLFRDKVLLDLLQVYGAETIYRWWRVASELDMRRLRSQQAHTAIPPIEEGVDGAAAPLGLAAPANSEKRRRGLGGLTTHGKNLVREAAFGLQRKYGRSRLSFWTCTLPPLSESDTREVCKNWSKILDNLRHKLVYHLKKQGLPTHIVGVTELQPDRWKKERYPAWHVHWLFVGRKRMGKWLLTTEQMDKLWQEAVEEWCSGTYSFGTSCRLERVRSNAAAYLAKYMSKGSTVAGEVEANWPGAVPSSWYTCTNGLKRWVKVNVRSSESVSRWVYQMVQNMASDIRGLWAFTLEARDGVEIAVCWLGRIPDPYPPRVPL